MSVTSVNIQFEIAKQDVINGTKNYVCSQKYIERIVKASVVNIIFHRLPIPEKFFDTKEFETVPYRSFNAAYQGSAIAQLYRKWIKGFQDSFRKKYLKEFILYFTDSSQDIHENFKFKFNYEENISKDKACSDLTDPTVLTLKNLIVLGEIPKLPMNIQMHVELFYIQETPEDYQPPFFDSKDYMSTLKSKLEMEDCPYESTALARINTGFHYFTFVFKKKSSDSQFLQDREKPQKRKRKSVTTEEAEYEKKELESSQKLEEKKIKWDLSDSKVLQSMTSIDLISNADSRDGVSFNVDYDLNSEDIDIISRAVTPVS